MTKVGVTEARRRLPELVEQVASEGGRVDITRRGQVKVSLVRTSDLARATEAPAIRLEILIPSEDVEDAVKELRSRTGGARPIGSPRATVPRKR